MSTTFIREVPAKTFKDRIQLQSIIYFFILLFVNLIGLNLPGSHFSYFALFTCCVLLIWFIQVFIAQKIWFNKVEINEQGLMLYGFDLNRPIVRSAPFENYAIRIEFHNQRYVNADYYLFFLKSGSKTYILNNNHEWNDQLLFDILKELNKWRESKSFLIDGIHYLSDFEKRALNLKIK